jgi:hypothetical protein
MSHDLAFFEHRPGISEAEVRAAYLAYCRGTEADAGRESPALAAFVQSLESRYPSLGTLSDDELDVSPWSAEFDRGPTHLIVCMAFSRAPEVGQYIWELLQRNPLVVYDPQADEASFGTERLPPTPPAKPRTGWRFWK